MMRIGSMFAGIGGLDLAAEAALDGHTVWQLDQVNADVRRRHWPGALQVEADVRLVNPRDLPPIDVLIGGFPCTDLSVAGPGGGLLGERSGLYREVLRFADTLAPELVWMENVPPLLSQWRETLEDDWRRLGYGLTWVQAAAADVGAPHLRRRVFVLAQRGGPSGGVLSLPPCAAEEPWPTPTIKGNDNRASYGGASGDGLATAVRTPGQMHGKRLNPEWVESLMGLPHGWTSPTGPSQREQAAEWGRWPRGRYPETWDRTQVWPGYSWEAPRTLPDGPPSPGRPARIRALGNAVVWRCGAAALREALEPRQASLFG